MSEVLSTIKRSHLSSEGLAPVWRTVLLLTVSAPLSSFVCIGLSSILTFCSHFEGEDLKCLAGSSEGKFDSSLLNVILQMVLNPVQFPLTVTAVIPIMTILAFNQTLFLTQKTDQLKRRLAWSLFILTYSLFLCDLIIYSQSQTIVHKFLLLLHPLHWRFHLASLLRNGFVFYTALSQGIN